jgi:outer membrane immunogenic protein
MSRALLALGIAAGFAVAAPATAADMYGSRPAPAYGYQQPAAPASSWNGPYLGGQIGHGWGPNGLDGMQVGVYGGVNSTIGSNTVVGAEADLNISGQTADRLVNGGLYKYRSDWNGTIRGRVGVAFDKVMPYATGGIAFADNTLKALGRSSSNTSIGYAVGAGVEGQVVDRITVKGEVLHMGFGRTDHNGIGNGASSSVNTNVVRGGAAFHF